MCGLAGIACRDARRPDEAALRAMAEAVAHRGPDDAGQHVAPGIGLASRRLAILDLSPAGHMPMLSADGQVVLSWNGEIYNHVELREELKRRGVRFRSSGDTEVLLVALSVMALPLVIERDLDTQADGVPKASGP